MSTDINLPIYLDYASTTPVDPRVAKKISDHLTLDGNFGNPASRSHKFGWKAEEAVEEARSHVANLVGCDPREIVWTSGATEADNLALRSAVKDLGCERIITSPAEHSAVIASAEKMSSLFDVELTLVRHLEDATVDLAHLEELLSEGPKTLVSLMHANNEIGTIQDIKVIGELCKEYNAIFHSDTVQTMAHFPFDMQKLNVDFMAASAHKFHGPKGIGFLYTNSKTSMVPLIHGGAQERGLRGGTENIYGIVGLSKAMDLAYSDLIEHQKHVEGLKNHMIREFEKHFETIEFHGEISKEKSLYTVLNVCFPRTDKASMLLFTLDLKGIAVSGGSACSSGSNKGSHVLEGIEADMTRPNVRFSFSRYTTKEEIDYTVEMVVNIFKHNL